MHSKFHLLCSSPPQLGHFNDNGTHILHFDYMRATVFGVLSMMFYLILQNKEIGTGTSLKEFKTRPCIRETGRDIGPGYSFSYVR